jgi:hypothetical protein
VNVLLDVDAGEESMRGDDDEDVQEMAGVEVECVGARRSS